MDCYTNEPLLYHLSISIIGTMIGVWILDYLGVTPRLCNQYYNYIVLPDDSQSEFYSTESEDHEDSHESEDHEEDSEPNVITSENVEYV